MGYELVRLTEQVKEELLCTICTGVLEDPLQVPGCEHVFCRGCINDWIKEQPNCPVDRQPIKPEQLQPVPRILRMILSKLSISCDHATYGCTAVLNLDALSSHLADCEYDPKGRTHCEKGCGLVISKDELARHNCMRELQASIATLQQELAEQRLLINEQRQELTLQQARDTKVQQELADQRLTINEQRQELTLQQAGVKKFQQELADQRLTINEQRQELTLQQAGVTKVQQELAEQRLTIHEQRQELAQQQDGVTKVQQKLADQHFTINELRRELTLQQAGLTKCQQELADQHLTINEHKRELTLRNGEDKSLKINNTFSGILGIDVSEHRTGHIFITNIKEGSFSDMTPHIQVGDIIMDIDGKSVFGKSHYEVAKYIKETLFKGNSFTMELKRLSSAAPKFPGQTSC